MIGMVGHGGLVEKVAVDAAKLYRLPEGRSFAEGSALLLTYAHDDPRAARSRAV